MPTASDPEIIQAAATLVAARIAARVTHGKHDPMTYKEITAEMEMATRAILDSLPKPAPARSTRQ